MLIKMPTSKDGESIKEPDTMHYGSFPSGFLFGSSTIAHQVEGACQSDGKKMSIWDNYSQSHPNRIADRSTASETCDSYNKFEEDVIMLKVLNANTYSFSLSWSRILPDGLPTNVNQKGLDYYNDLINTLLENGIEPIVTLYNWDMPMSLMRKYGGGWMNEKLIYAFECYARICFKNFGDRVKQWITIAQPWEHSWKSFGNGAHPPNLCLGNKGAFLANTNMLKAHANVYQMYKHEFKPEQNGRIGISFSCSGEVDMDILRELSHVLYPITHGEYPKLLIGNSEIVQISEEWRNHMKGSFDFLTLCYTHSKLSLYEVLKLIKTEFDNPELIISCLGPSLESPTQLMDLERAQYFSRVASDILKGIELDECNVVGFLPGKLMDCWEWEHGFTKSFGLFHVDIYNQNKKRSPRASVAFLLKQLFKEKKLKDVFAL